MEAYPDVRVTDVTPRLGSDSWDTMVQFVLALNIGDEGAAGKFHFWLEFDTADYQLPLEIGDKVEVDQLAGGRYAIEVPPEPMVLPRFVFETPGSYLRVAGHYMPPDGSSSITIILKSFAITTDDSTETFSLESISERGVNPAEVRPPPLPSQTPEEPEPSEDDGGFVVGRDSESGDEMEDVEEESAPRSEESLGEEDEEEEEAEEEEMEQDEEEENEDEAEPSGGKRSREDDDADQPPKKSKRARFECANCTRKLAALMCGRCRTAYYCNKDCQVAHYGAHCLTCY
jgi:hypothetical protein